MSRGPGEVEDEFVGGRVRLIQPEQGYRAATDPVFLAASVDAEDGQWVLDLGCGAGAAAMCLGTRVPGLEMHGLELQPNYASLARRNGLLNNVPITIHEGDMRAMPEALKALNFDVVMMNPPWHPPETLGSPETGRDLANRLRSELTIWLAAAMARVRPRGWLVMIQRAEWLPMILGDLSGRAGDIAVLPLTARAGRPAKRVIVKARKGSAGPFRLASPLVIHEGDTHPGDKEHYTKAARDILRNGAPLTF